MKNNTDFYPGYGVFFDEAVGKALFGKDTESIVVSVKDVELVILERYELPESLQQTDLPEGFRIYAARRKEGSSVQVRVWALSKEQRKLADDLNFGDQLYRREDVAVAFMLMPMDLITRNDIGRVVSGLDYEPHLNNREITLSAAREAYERSLPNKEGGLSRERK